MLHNAGRQLNKNFKTEKSPFPTPCWDTSNCTGNTVGSHHRFQTWASPRKSCFPSDPVHWRRQTLSVRRQATTVILTVSHTNTQARKENAPIWPGWERRTSGRAEAWLCARCRRSRLPSGCGAQGGSWWWRAVCKNSGSQSPSRRSVGTGDTELQRGAEGWTRQTRQRQNIAITSTR